jgi:CheY-like chemotaxis protein
VHNFADHCDTIDLVILDVIMPKKSGRQACEEIRALKPNIKVLFSSGYTAEKLDQSLFEEKNVGYIGKPVLPPDLLRKVREMLNLRDVQNGR